MALYNIAPVLPGHSLIIPTLHITSILELSNDEMVGLFDTARRALYILIKAFKTEAFDWSLQERPEAGQTIEHLHLHIVPRIHGDLPKPGDWYPLLQNNDTEIIDSINRKRLGTVDMQQIVDKLRHISYDLE